MPQLKYRYGVRGITETYSYSEYTTYLNKTYKVVSITKLGFQNSQNFTIEVDNCNIRAFGSYSVFINNVNKVWLLKISTKKQKRDKQKTEMEIHSPKTPR